MLTRHQTTFATSRGNINAFDIGQGPVVLCLHGFPDHNLSFHRLATALANANFRAVCPVLPGYQPCSQLTDASYSLNALAPVFKELIEQLGDDVYLVGHDWGAIIAYQLARDYPSTIRALVTLAVPPIGDPSVLFEHPGQILKSLYIAFFLLPKLPEFLVAKRDFAFLETLWRRWSPGYSWSANDFEILKQQFSQTGVVAAALSYYRDNFSAQGVRDSRASWNTPITTPTLLLTGSDDGCIGTALYDTIDATQFSGRLQITRIHNAGHFLHLERPDSVNEAIISFISTEG